MIIELTPGERYAQEAALPPIFDKGFHPERIDWYTRLVVESERVRGGALVVPEFIAAMIGEANLVNASLGDSKPDPPIGVGWCQLDTGHHVASIDAFHAIRADPLWSLLYVTDPVNGLCFQGGAVTHFEKQRWHAWEPELIDPQTGWSALNAAYTAFNRVTS